MDQFMTDGRLRLEYGNILQDLQDRGVYSLHTLYVIDGNLVDAWVTKTQIDPDTRIVRVRISLDSEHLDDHAGWYGVTSLSEVDDTVQIHLSPIEEGDVTDG